jgi:hypothetical protein
VVVLLPLGLEWLAVAVVVVVATVAVVPAAPEAAGCVGATPGVSWSTLDILNQIENRCSSSIIQRVSY